MEIQGAAYLYALAALGMAFLSFTAVVVIIRQTFGTTGLSQIQLLITQVLIEHGYVVVGFSVAPLLLALFNLPHDTVWRVSSAIAAVTIASWSAIYGLWRYPAVRAQRHPLFARINFAMTGAAVIVLLSNSIGYPLSPQVGPYALAITWILFEGANIFLLSIKAFLREPKSQLKASRSSRRK